MIPDASWPIDTELENKVSRIGQARLSTSVWMACTPRLESAAPAFLDDVLGEMRPVIRERLLYFWSKQIRGADFFISAIGPALSVFGRHTKVMYPDGKDVSVRDFLDLVRRESTEVALEQVLGGHVMGQVDSLTRQYVTWVWGYSRAPLDAGEAIALCLATGADYAEVVRPGSIAAEAKEKSKKIVKLRTIKERGEKEDELGISNGARPSPSSTSSSARPSSGTSTGPISSPPTALRSAKPAGQPYVRSARPSPSASQKGTRTAA